jgi:hypothetical protein
MSRTRQLILATAVGYDWTQIGPFVRSLRRTGYRGAVLMLVGPLSADDRRQLDAHEITVWRIQSLFGLLPRLVRQKLCGRKLRHLHAVIARLHGDSAGDCFPRYFEHITCARYDYYRAYLRRHGHRYDRVMTSDTRDVLFQADPFSDSEEAPLEFFLEHRGTTIGSEVSNANWVRAVYGEAGLAALAPQRVSCSGITRGTSAAMGSYLDAITAEFARTLPHTAGLPYIDQAVHNHLLWSRRLPQARAIENGAGAVLTMHGVPDPELRFDAAGRVVAADGRIIPVLHQFDRHPAHAARLVRLLG